MQTLQNLSSFTTFLPLPSKPLPKPQFFHKSHFTNKPFKPNLPLPFRLRSYSSDEYPVGDNDAFLASFGPKEKESEEEARRRNWVERGWAPWEEILTPEADFARRSLNEGEEVPLQNPETIEAFRMLSPKYRKEKIKEMGLTEDEYYAKQFEIKGEIPDPLETVWSGPLVLGLVPPRDWPPRGWEVDKDELEFIRGAHKVFSSVRVDYEKVLEDESVEKESEDMCLERYNVLGIWPYKYAPSESTHCGNRKQIREIKMTQGFNVETPKSGEKPRGTRQENTLCRKLLQLHNSSSHPKPTPNKLPTSNTL